MKPQAPFDKYPANHFMLEDRADQLVSLAELASDQQAVTDRAFDPAVASWDGLAAPELREAPEPVRKDAQEVASQLAWAAVPLRYWADQVRDFNDKVTDLQKRLDDVPAEVERRLREQFGDGLMDLEHAPEFPSARSFIRGEIIRELEQEWHTALATHVDDGERTTASMFRNGPTWENLETARQVGAIPDSEVVAYFATEWGRSAALAEAEEIAGEIIDPSHLTTDPELKRLAEVLGAYAADEEFAYQFLTQLGPEGLLVLTGQVGLLGRSPIPVRWPTLLGEIQAGFATALATATTRRGAGGNHTYAAYEPGEFELSAEWIYELTRFGRQQLTIGDSTQVYGYQALSVLLGQGGYDDQFLSIIGSDMIDFELASGGSDVWREADGYWERLNWLESPYDETALRRDPMVGLMEALAESPEATREILTSRVVQDGTPGGRLPRLDYLLTDRYWLPDMVPGPGSGLPPNALEIPGIAALGTALEGATTQDPDGRSHRIVEVIIHEIANDEQVKGYPNDPSGRGSEEGNQAFGFDQVDIVSDTLRPYLGRIAANYIDDLHWSAAGRTDSGLRLPGEREVYVPPQDLDIFLAELGKNAEARDTVMLAEDVYTAALYDHILSGAGTQTEPQQQLNAIDSSVFSPAGRVFGALDYGALTEIDEKWNEEAEEYNRALRHRYFFGELGVNTAQDIGLPDSIGTLVQQQLDQSEQNDRATYVGEADFEGRTLRELGRERMIDQLRQALYRHVDPDDLPDDVRARLVDESGELVPIDDWIGDSEDYRYKAWDRYLSDEDADFGGWLEDEALDEYDDAFDKVQKSIAGSTLPRRG